MSEPFPVQENNNLEAVRTALAAPHRPIREFFETLAIALFLASVFKFYEAEAYVIPTGSMATTLMGRHKDVRCQGCGYPFQVSASEERDRQNRATSSRVLGGTCPQCRLTQRFDSKDISFSGDRVLVNKFVGDFRPIERWDVTVFRSPPDLKTNYIKRFVALPNEDVRIQYGNLYACQRIPGAVSEPKILRKPIRNFLRLLRVVYDNDYPPFPLENLGWPPRWQDERAAAQEETLAWQPIDDGRGFYYSGERVPVPEGQVPALKCAGAPPEREKDQFEWLRYRHIIPTARQWAEAANQSLPSDLKETGVIPNNPQLITDMNAYNAPETGGHRSPASQGYNWTGELAVSLNVTPYMPKENAPAEIILELVQGNTPMRARFNLSAGTVTLEMPTVPQFEPQSAPCPFEPGKTSSLLFANIDEQLRVLVNKKEISFAGEGKYDTLCASLSGGAALLPRNRDPGPLDLSPVSIGANFPMKVEHIKVMRDTYYIALGNHLEDIEISAPVVREKPLFRFGSRDPIDHLFSMELQTDREDAVARFLSDPTKWADYGNTRSVLVHLGDNEYLALGDNSSNSEDCRSWGRPDGDWPDGEIPPCVDRRFVLGKAVSVYWPHGKIIPGTRLPFVPNFAKMRKIN